MDPQGSLTNVDNVSKYSKSNIGDVVLCARSESGMSQSWIKVSQETSKWRKLKYWMKMTLYHRYLLLNDGSSFIEKEY